MRIRVLGSAAGGGSPQWNCACHQCERVRRDPQGRRTQDSVAVSGEGGPWYLLNVSPDVRTQILATPELVPGPGTRESPLAGVLLTSAELDHTLGLASLREGARLDILASAAVAGALPLRRMLEPYADHRWREVWPGKPFRLGGGLTATAIPLSGKRPRYAPADGGDTWVVAYRIHDHSTGGSLVYAPNIAAWPTELDHALADAHCALVDGTFWTDDEPKVAGLGSSSAAAMGHLPICGPGGTLEHLARHSGRHLLTHLNNTNPALDPRSPERATLTSLGVEVADDGLAITI